MIEERLTNTLKEMLPYEPTQGQQRLFERMAAFIRYPEKPGVLLLKGYSGTGKTTAMKAFVELLKDLNISVELMAPTGRAAKVLAGYTGHTALTVHKVIYRQRSEKDGFGKFEVNFNKAFQTYFVIDEASMIPDKSADYSMFGSGRLLDDIFDFVFSGRQCKLILIGDTAQLPPIGLNISPALEKDYLEHYGYPVQEVFLTEVVRQEKGSGILSNATRLRHKIAKNDFALPMFSLNACPDVIRISGREMIELLEDYFQDTYPDEAVIIVRSNRMANRYNEGIRQQILFREDTLTPGDRVMVVKNNYFWAPPEEEFIANGDIFEIKKIDNREEKYGYYFADVTLGLQGNPAVEIDAKVILDTLTAETPALTSAQNKELFYTILEDDPSAKKTRKHYEQVRRDPYFNALQIKFAYAITCHKAQGGQWPTVFLDQGFITEERIDIEYLRWLYTAVTRAVEKLYLVNFNDVFFGP